MIGCGPGGTCCGHCAAGLGEATAAAALPPTAYPRTTQVLYDYAVAQLAAGRPFWISEDLNSRTLAADGLGFWAAVWAAAVKVGTTIATVAPKVASVAALVKSTQGQAGGGTSGGSSASPTADQIASAILPNVNAALQAKGVTLPAAVAGPAVSASLLDAFGAQNRGLVLAGAAGLGMLLVFKVLRR